MKNNPNQICWLLEKVQRSSDTQNGFTTFQQFLDNQQYTNRGILRYEKMFGAGYVSTGGPCTTKVAIWSKDTQIKKEIASQFVMRKKYCKLTAITISCVKELAAAECWLLIHFRAALLLPI